MPIHKWVTARPFQHAYLSSHTPHDTVTSSKMTPVSFENKLKFLPSAYKVENESRHLSTFCLLVNTYRLRCIPFICYFSNHASTHEFCAEFSSSTSVNNLLLFVFVGHSEKFFHSSCLLLCGN